MFFFLFLLVELFFVLHQSSQNLRNPDKSVVLYKLFSVARRFRRLLLQELCQQVGEDTPLLSNSLNLT